MLDSFLEIFWLQSPAWRIVVMVVFGVALACLFGLALLLAEVGIREALAAFGISVVPSKSDALAQAQSDLREQVRRERAQ